MTPQQQQALEGLVGRTLTQAEADEIELYLATRNDVAIAGILSRGRTRRGPVAKSAFQMWAGANGVRATIEDLCEDKASPLRSSALTLRDFIYSTVQVIDFSELSNQQLLGAWLQAGKVTQQQASELQALGDVAAPIDYNAVSVALNVAEGRMML